MSRTQLNVYRLKVKEVAISKGFNMATLSRKSDVPINTIRRVWKDDRYPIYLPTLDKIAQALDVPTSDLIEDMPNEGLSHAP